MITIIVGTNRPHSNTAKIAQLYSNELSSLDIPHKILNLESKDILYRNDLVKALEQEYLLATDKFILILPEYNGSFPGIFKLLLDNTDIRNCWWHKKAMLTGVADGRGGNLRGLEHMTNILHYLKVNVYYHKVHLSKINQLLDENGNIQDEAVAAELKNQVIGFSQY